MKANALTLLASASLLLGALWGYRAWQAYRHPSVVIAWSTASELDTAGFNILRAESPDGPFQRLNASLIPPAEDPLAGGEYEYVDFQVEAGKTYYYQLQDLNAAGSASLHGPIEASVGRGGLVESALAAALLGGSALVWWHQWRKEWVNDG